MIRMWKELLMRKKGLRPSSPNVMLRFHPTKTTVIVHKDNTSSPSQADIETRWGASAFRKGRCAISTAPVGDLSFSTTDRGRRLRWTSTIPHVLGLSIAWNWPTEHIQIPQSVMNESLRNHRATEPPSNGRRWTVEPVLVAYIILINFISDISEGLLVGCWGWRIIHAALRQNPYTAGTSYKQIVSSNAFSV